MEGVRDAVLDYGASLRPGYQIAEVDELVARIEATIITGTRPGQAVTAADVQAATFGTTRLGGYDEQVVDEALDCYAAALARLALSADSTTGPDTDCTNMTR